jgi:phage gpG-like protein
MIETTVTGTLPNSEDLDLSKIMASLADYQLGSVRHNFVVGGRPETWSPLKSGDPSFLFRRGDLLQSIVKESGDRWFEVLTDIYYAKFPQFGTKFMTARPFMLFQEEDIEVAKSQLQDHIVNFYNAKGEQIG